MTVRDQAHATGWAVIERGAINVRSVSPHRRGAIVNFLVTERRMMVTDAMSDEQIERCWVGTRGGADVCEVIIITKEFSTGVVQ